MKLAKLVIILLLATKSIVSFAIASPGGSGVSVVNTPDTYIYVNSEVQLSGSNSQSGLQAATSFYQANEFSASASGNFEKSLFGGYASSNPSGVSTANISFRDLLNVEQNSLGSLGTGTLHAQIRGSYSSITSSIEPNNYVDLDLGYSSEGIYGGQDLFIGPSFLSGSCPASFLTGHTRSCLGDAQTDGTLAISFLLPAEGSSFSIIGNLRIQSVFGGIINFQDGLSIWLEVPYGVVLTSGSGVFPVSTSPVPEPSSSYLFFVGVGVMMLYASQCHSTRVGRNKKV